MRLLRPAMLLLAIIVALGCASNVPVNVSIGDLISNPDAYDGQVVKVVGYMKIQFENTNVFTSQQAAQQHDESQCLALLIEVGSFERYSKQFNNNAGTITGKYDAAACKEDEICTWFCSKRGIYVDRITPG